MQHGPGDERAHRPGDDPAWAETWGFECALPDGPGVFVRLSLFPHQRAAWYWAYLMLADGLVVVRDHEVPLPRAQSRDLEIRADALWSELVCETPMVHWGIGLEAFGVRLDDPADALAGERGERVAVGLDLEWETIAPAFDDGPSRYHHVGRVHGDLLVGADRIAIDGVGARDHGWGDSVWWPEGRHRAAFAIGEGLAGEVTSGPGAVVDGYLWRPGEVPGPLTTALVEISPRDADQPASARYVLNGEVEIEAEIRAVAPVPLTGEEHLLRALCHFTADDRTGAGFAEWTRRTRR